MSFRLSLWLLALALCGGHAHAGLCRKALDTEIASYKSPLTSPGIISPVDGTCWLANVMMPSFDGTKLAASVFLPKGADVCDAAADVL